MKRIRRFIAKKVNVFVFWLFSRKKVDKKLVVFADQRSAVLPDNMVPVYNLLKQKGYKCIAVLTPLKYKNKFKVLLNSIKFTRYFAHAGFVVLTDYYPPAYMNETRPETKVIQLWHAAGAFKKWGYSTAEKAWGHSKEFLERHPIHTNYTHVVVSSPEVIPHYAEAFNLSKEKIFAYGVPRTDVFFDPDFIASGKEKLQQLFPEAAGKKVILYAPTFRGVKIEQSYNEDNLDFNYLRSVLGENYVFVTKYHPFLSVSINKNKNKYPDFVKDVTGQLEIDAALCAADILISDYSSLIFEYSLLARPMLFYAYDLNDYIDERGLYYPYTGFAPGPIVKNNEELAAALLETEKNFDPARINAFREKFMSACDGHATERIVEKIFEK